MRPAAPSPPPHTLLRASAGHLLGLGLSVLLATGGLRPVWVLVLAALAMTLCGAGSAGLSALPPGLHRRPQHRAARTEALLCLAARLLLSSGVASVLVAGASQLSVEEMILVELATTTLAAGAFAVAALVGAQAEVVEVAEVAEVEVFDRSTLRAPPGPALTEQQRPGPP